MKNYILLLFILSSKLTFGQIINGDFEVWDTTYCGYYSSLLRSDFAVPNAKSGVVNLWTSATNLGICQTTDSYSGNYALILHNWYLGGKQQITHRAAISSLPLYLIGYYKYITGGANGLSVATVKVTATKFNGNDNDTIATGTFQFDSTNVYTPFQLKISLTSIIPDSISIYFINSNKNCNKTDVCNLLFLDNLNFTNSSLIVETINLSEGTVTFNPNPFSSETNLQTDKIFKDATLSICNSFGQVLKQINHISGQSYSLYRDNLPSGLYFLYLEDDHTIEGKYKIIISD